MRNEIFNLLKSFSQKDFRDFNKFLRSPYFNQNRRVTELFREVSRYHPFYAQRQLDKIILYRKVFKSNEYNEENLKHLFYQLLHLCERYLIQRRFESDYLNSQNYLLEELILREESNWFIRRAKCIQNSLNHDNIYDGNYFYNLFRFECHIYNFKKINDNIIKKEKITDQLRHLESSNNYLFLSFISELICQFVNQKIISIKYNLPPCDSLAAIFLKQLNFEELNKKLDIKPLSSFLNLYCYLYKLFSNLNSSKYYGSYKKLLETGECILSKDEKCFHYFCLISYLIIRNNQEPENHELLLELFDIYELVLEKEYYLDNKIDYLPHSLYRAVLFLSIRLHKYDWVKKIVDNYSQKVHPKEKDNMFNYGYAYYNFLIGKLNNALDNINRISLDYFKYKYDIKILQLKIFYEMGYLEETLQNIHTYREFLRVDKFLNCSAKTAHKNFIQQLERLVLFQYNKVGINIEYLKYQVMNTNNILYKDWILEKMNNVRSSANIIV